MTNAASMEDYLQRIRSAWITVIDEMISDTDSGSPAGATLGTHIGYDGNWAVADYNGGRKRVAVNTTTGEVKHFERKIGQWEARA